MNQNKNNILRIYHISIDCFIANRKQLLITTKRIAGGTNITDWIHFRLDESRVKFYTETLCTISDTFDLHAAKWNRWISHKT